MLGQSVFEWTHKLVLCPLCLYKSPWQNYAYLFSMRQAHFLKPMVSQGKATYTWVCMRMMPQTAPQFAFGCQGDCQTLCATLSQAHGVLLFIRHAFPDLFCSIKHNVYSNLTCFLHLTIHLHLETPFIDNGMICKKINKYTFNNLLHKT